jgi:hypothetical protein
MVIRDVVIISLSSLVAKPMPERVEYREAAFIDHDGLAVHDT